MSNTIENPVVQPLVVHTVQAFMKMKNFVSVHKSVRANANGYPFITFINDKNEAENIYFSKAGSEIYGKDMAIERGFFAPLTIVESYNADNELRYKLSIGSENRLNVENLF